MEILIVEDEQEIAAIIQECLEAETLCIQSTRQPATKTD